MKTCPHCGQHTADTAQYCVNCGYRFHDSVNYASSDTRWQSGPAYRSDNCFDSYGPEGKSRGVAALLAILLGTLGVQYFYLGKITAGILSIVISLISCGVWNIVTIIQGIYMFSITNEQFHAKYVSTGSTFPLF